jgi:hypothetical protein
LLPQGTAPFCIPTSSVWGLHFHHIFPTLVITFLIIAFLVSIKWYLMVLICIHISHNTNNTGHIFIVDHLCIFWRNVHSDPPFFSGECLDPVQGLMHARQVVYLWVTSIDLPTF